MNEAEDKQAAVSEWLEALEGDHGGEVTPDQVWKAAKADKDSPAHSFFDWDKTQAAENWWRAQARRLLRMRVVVKTETNTIRAPRYVRNPKAPADRQSYVSIRTAKSEEEMAREVVMNEFKRVAESLKRARDVAAVLGMRENVEQLMHDVGTMRTQIEAPAAQQ